MACAPVCPIHFVHVTWEGTRPGSGQSCWLLSSVRWGGGCHARTGRTLHTSDADAAACLHAPTCCRASCCSHPGTWSDHACAWENAGVVQEVLASKVCTGFPRAWLTLHACVTTKAQPTRHCHSASPPLVPTQSRTLRPAPTRPYRLAAPAAATQHRIHTTRVASTTAHLHLHRTIYIVSSASHRIRTYGVKPPTHDMPTVSRRRDVATALTSNDSKDRHAGPSCMALANVHPVYPGVHSVHSPGASAAQHMQQGWTAATP